MKISNIFYYFAYTFYKIYIFCALPNCNDESNLNSFYTFRMLYVHLKTNLKIGLQSLLKLLEFERKGK